ncbi:MAG: thiamine-monophosphate kinase [Paenibacillaceae bacterium]|jgi:thiamine-monophosphate kinase|nr:thiamine-monophosphate kinase [Paenibacillaceae bacterium]
MPRVDEFGLIRLLTGGRPRPHLAEQADPEGGVAVGIGDDAAVLNGRNGFQWVVTCDTMVRDIHFKPETMTYEAIGYKAMASNISDLAAMGAIPRFAVVALSVPASMETEALRELYDGLYACASRYGVAVVGGDTTSCPRDMTVSVTAIGEVETGRALLRSGARPGDAVFVTGPLGLSAAGLHLLLAAGRSAYEAVGLPEERQQLVRAHQFPQPQVEAGRLLVRSGLGRSLNDVSDGLASEAWELAEASGCVIELDEALLPEEPALAGYAREAGLDQLELMLYGGEDYRLTGTVRREDAEAAQALFQAEGLSFHLVGRVLAEGALTDWKPDSADAAEAAEGARTQTRRPDTIDGKDAARQPSVDPSVLLKRRDGSVIPLQKRGYNHFKEDQSADA